MNGSEVNQNSHRSQSAREMTDEIEQATNLAIEERDLAEQRARLGGASMAAVRGMNGIENGKGAAENMQTLGGLTSERSVNLGNKILTYNPDQVAREQRQMQRDTERVREIAETESGLAGRAEEGASTVGMESAVLSGEREAQSQENLLNELDPKRDHEAQIMARDQTGVAREMATIVEGMTRNGNFRIMELEVALSKGRDRMLEAFENPRRLGDRN